MLLSILQFTKYFQPRELFGVYSTEMPWSAELFGIIVLLSLHPLSLRALGSSDGKASACNAGDPGSIPGSGISPGEGNGNPLQYSYLENSMDRGPL